MDHYAVIGNPVHHSRSPAIHRQFALQTGQNLIYTAIQVESGHLAQVLDDFAAQQGRGLNVTAPLKQSIMPLLNDISPRARQAGAINTILFQPDGRRLGENTDGVGFIRDVIFNHQVKLNNARILLLGAGGAAHGLLPVILAEQPASVTIANRTPGKASTLAAGHPVVSVLPWLAATADAFDIIINSTAPTEPQLTLPASWLQPETYCYDLVYGPTLTPFLRWATALGCTHYHDGLGMLVEQAAESFYLWRNVRPDPRPVLDWLRTAL